MFILPILTLYNLEHDIFDGKAMCPGRLQGTAYTKFRLIDRVREKVDIEPAVNAEPGCKLDGLDTTTLVETVEIVLVDLLINLAGRFIACPAYQRFIGKYTPLIDIDNRLEDIREIEIQLRCISTVARFVPCGIFQVHTLALQFVVVISTQYRPQSLV